jgi:hypothetical protein
MSIEEKAKEKSPYTENTWQEGYNLWESGFSKGANWMQSELIEKAVEWFKHQKEEIGISWFDDFEIRFRKAMKN